ncbi:N-acetylmuramoyl-L-alanine amidase [Streptomyces thermolineatus]|uniref:N-acetylmuramoyl-L-alanine amidase n=1 Tax=Streptomyces thermolineatus TaxID=44033 RepID=UPI00384FC475
MATPLSADRLVAALRAEGLKVVEYRSWRTNNRNSKGAWGPVHGVMIHHTVTEGTDASVRLCYEGHSSLPGPLCHGVIAKDGTVYLVGNGRANHAGLGDDDVLRAVINEAAALPADNEANTDGNARFYGFECVNLGDGRDPWPAAQLEAIEKASAAVCRAHGWSERSVIGHLEWQPGKVDPKGFTMSSMRTRIGDRLDGPPDAEEDPVPKTIGLYDADNRKLAPGGWTTLPVERTTLLTGATVYDVLVQLTLTAPAGGTVQGRFFHLRADGSRWTGGIVERGTSGGKSFLDFPGKGSIRAAEKLQFEVAYFPAAPDDTAAAVIDTRRARGLYWA